MLVSPQVSYVNVPNSQFLASNNQNLWLLAISRLLLAIVMLKKCILTIFTLPLNLRDSENSPNGVLRRETPFGA